MWQCIVYACMCDPLHALLVPEEGIVCEHLLSCGADTHDMVEVCLRSCV